MPWNAFVSVGVFIIFTGLLVALEYKYRKKAKKDLEDVEEVVKPGAKVANELYKRKYGKPPVELINTFPELKNLKKVKESGG